MDAFREAAMDAGYRGAEAAAVAQDLELQQRERNRRELEEEIAHDRYLEAREALEVEHLDSLERSLPPEWATA